jgi:hypothetical protein
MAVHRLPQPRRTYHNYNMPSIREPKPVGRGRERDSVSVGGDGQRLWTHVERNHALAELYESLCSQHVDRHRKLQLLVELDGGGRVKHHGHGSTEERLIGLGNPQLLAGDVAMDRNDFVQVVGTLFAKLVEERPVEDFAES